MGNEIKFVFNDNKEKIIKISDSRRGRKNSIRKRKRQKGKKRRGRKNPRVTRWRKIWTGTKNKKPKKKKKYRSC